MIVIDVHCFKFLEVNRK